MERVNRRIVCFLLIAMSAAAPAVALASSEDDTRNVRAMISAQFQAFADDDADAAFATATPMVRSAMGHPLRFLAMVRGTYPMVYRPAAFSFLDTQLQGRNAYQLVRIADPKGQQWLALFALERQADGSWRIGSCSVSEARWQPA